MGRGRFAIEEANFPRDAEFAQMMSYRTASREGPAISSIIRARRPLLGDYPSPNLRPPVMPAPMSRQQSRQAPFRPVVKQLSFLDILAGLAPAIGNLLGGLAGGGSGSAPAPGAGTAVPGGDILARLADPVTIRLLSQLVSQIGGLPATAAPTPVPPVTSTTSSSTAHGLGYSESMIAPALLAALPALMPLLQQVLTPQTIQTLVDAPNRAAQTVINGVTDVMRIGVEADQNFMDHLRQLNPGVDDPALDRIIEGMGLSLGKQSGNQSFVRTSRVRLAFDGLQSLTVAGANRILFAHDRELRLPMLVELPKLKSGQPPKLADPELLLEVKDPTNLKVRKRVRTKLEAIAASGPIGAVALPADAVAALEAGRDWLLCVSLTWRAPRKIGANRLGALMSTLVHLAGPLVFDGLDDEGDAIDLADPEQHRAVWHKLWAGRFSPEAKRFDTEVDYTYDWDAAANEVIRRETGIRTKPSDGTVASATARVKGGLTLTPQVLADVAASLDPGVAPLDPAARIALADPVVSARLGLGARLRLKFRGRDGEAFALWAYPAVRRATLLLAAPDTILETGNIASLSPRPVPFVVPVAINILGTRAR